MAWLRQLLRRGISFTIWWRYYLTGAYDRCAVCGVHRYLHEMSHQFKEVE